MAMRSGALVAFCVFCLACSGSNGKKAEGSGGEGGADETGGSGGSGGKATGGSGGSTGGTGGATGGTGGSSGSGGSGGAPVADAAADTGGSADGPSGDVAAKPDLTPGGPFTLTSSAFAANGVIMKKYRCQGENEGGNVSPPLSWTPGPVGTKSYAVTMRSGGSPHWALWDISADTLSLPEKIERLAMPPVPPGSKQCKPNVDGSTWFGYAGACPMGGNNLRPYYYVVWALKVDVLPGVTPNSTISQVNQAIMANQIGMAQLIGQAAPNSP